MVERQLGHKVSLNELFVALQNNSKVMLSWRSE